MHTEQLVAVQRNHVGDIVSFKTSEGRIISYRKALLEVQSGTIDGVHVLEGVSEIPVITPQTFENFDHYPSIY